MAEAAKDYKQVLSEGSADMRVNPRRAVDLYAMGSLSIEINDFEPAENYFLGALHLLKKNPMQAAEVRLSLGGLFGLLGKFSDGESNLKQAVATFTKYAGSDDLRTAKAWNGLGWLYIGSGRPDDAEAALRHAEAIMDKALPPGSVDRVRFLDSQAELLTSVGRYSEAERLWGKALGIAQKSFGEDSPECDILLLHLGQMYSWLGDYTSARETLQQYLDIEQRVVPSGSASQAVALGELGNSFAHLGNNRAAEEKFAHSTRMLNDIAERLPLADALVASYLGNYYMSQRRWQEAAEQYQQALGARQEVVPNAAIVADSMLSLSKALDKLKRKGEAKKYRKEAEAILAKQHSPAYGQDTVDVKSFQASK